MNARWELHAIDKINGSSEDKLTIHRGKSECVCHCIIRMIKTWHYQTASEGLIQNSDFPSHKYSQVTWAAQVTPFSDLKCKADFFKFAITSTELQFLHSWWQSRQPFWDTPMFEHLGRFQVNIKAVKCKVKGLAMWIRYCFLWVECHSKATSVLRQQTPGDACCYQMYRLRLCLWQESRTTAGGEIVKHSYVEVWPVQAERCSRRSWDSTSASSSSTRKKTSGTIF